MLFLDVITEMRKSYPDDLYPLYRIRYTYCTKCLKMRCEILHVSGRETGGKLSFVSKVVGKVKKKKKWHSKKRKNGQSCLIFRLRRCPERQHQED